MKVIILITCLFVAIDAGLLGLTRVPSFDSAVIKSDRLGGNFAYSTLTGHAYAAYTPVVQNVVSPVGVTYQTSPLFTTSFLTQPSIISPVAPGVVAPGFPAIPTIPVVPTVPGFPAIPTIPAVPEATPEPGKPAEPAVEVSPVPEAPQPAPETQSDDAVSVESA